MRLLSGACTSWTWRRVQADEVQRGLLLRAEFSVVAAWSAHDEVAVPALIAPATEGEAAVLADRKPVNVGLRLGCLLSFRMGSLLGLAVRLVLGLVQLEPFRLLALIGPSRALAPRSWAVDRVFV